MNLMRARNLCWLALALLAVGIPLSFAWQGGGLGLAGLAGIAYVVALGFMSIAGNHLGQFGLKYPLAAMLGAGVLAQFGTPLAGFIAPVVVFFWLKGEVGRAYRAQMVADGVPSAATLVDVSTPSNPA